MEAWHEEWSQMPWRVLTSPVERFQELPSFVVGEFVFMALAVVTLVHAVHHGRLHVVTWVAALVAGTVNDAIFMMLPMVDNFWQAQASVMLTPRMCLYIPCVYVVFMYSSTVAVWRLGLPVLSTAALSGLMGEMIYSPYDITGAKFLWWTWHDTDAPVLHRLLGVPVGSSAWVITFTASFQFLTSTFLVPSSTTRSCSSLARGFLVTVLMSTPLMMVQMALLQLVTGESQGLPTARSLLAAIFLFSSVTAYHWPRRHPTSTPHWTNLLLASTLAAYFTFLGVNMLVTDPASHVSTGVHQTRGDCSVEERDFAGHLRQVYLCEASHQQDFSLDCVDVAARLGLQPGEESASWYTVCGKPHQNHALYAAITAGLGVMGTFSYFKVLVLLRRRSKLKQ